MATEPWPDPPPSACEPSSSSLQGKCWVLTEYRCLCCFSHIFPQLRLWSQEHLLWVSIMGSFLFSFPLSMIFQFPETKFPLLDFQNSNLETQYFPNLPKFYKNVKPLFWHLPPSARPWSLNYFAPSLTKHWHFLRWTRETTIWFIFFDHWIWAQAWSRRNEVILKRKKLSHFCLFHREHVYVQ